MGQAPLRRESTNEPISIREMDDTRRSGLGRIFLGVRISLPDRSGQGFGYGVRLPRLARRHSQLGGFLTILIAILTDHPRFHSRRLMVDSTTIWARSSSRR